MRSFIPLFLASTAFATLGFAAFGDNRGPDSVTGTWKTETPASQVDSAPLFPRVGSSEIGHYRRPADRRDHGGTLPRRSVTLDSPRFESGDANEAR